MKRAFLVQPKGGGGTLSPVLSNTGNQYYRARYYDPTIGRFLSEDPLRLSGSASFYAYVENAPTDLVDPSGLYKIDNRIRQHVTMGWSLNCPANAAGACTVGIASVLFCSCHSGECDQGWRASATLRIYGEMWVYNGPWALLPRRPKDKSVHDSASAIAHENNVHINPGIASVTPLLEQLEAKKFPTESECNAACVAAQTAIPKTFSDTVARTQREEDRGH